MKDQNADDFEKVFKWELWVSELVNDVELDMIVSCNVATVNIDIGDYFITEAGKQLHIMFKTVIDVADDGKLSWSGSHSLNICISK